MKRSSAFRRNPWRKICVSHISRLVAITALAKAENKWPSWSPPFFFACSECLKCLKWGCQSLSTSCSASFQLRGRNTWCPELQSLWRSHKSLQTYPRLVHHFTVRGGFTRQNCMKLHEVTSNDKETMQAKSAKSKTKSLCSTFTDLGLGS